MQDLTGMTPDEIVKKMNLPHQRALFDFDLSLRERTIIGADPADLSRTPMEPIHSIVSENAVITIMAHPGQEQMVADMLAHRPDLKNLTMSYADAYLKDGVLDFAFHAHTQEETNNIRRALRRKDHHRHRN